MKKEFYKVFQRAQAYISENYAVVLEQQGFDPSESYLVHFLEPGKATVPGMERQVCCCFSAFRHTALSTGSARRSCGRKSGRHG